MNTLGNRRTLWLALLLAIPALLPLAAPGYFLEAHDARHSIFFLVEFDQAVHDGALWPVWGPDHAVGFGYPLWLLYAPLAYFIAEGFHLLGLGFAASVKATWALCFIIGALGMYRLGRRWWGPTGALIASVAYTYAPYHLAQIYVRGALAEFAALAWFPWVLLAFAKLWDAPGARRTAWAALSLGILLLTHTVSTLIFIPLLGGFLLLWAVQTWRNKQDAGAPAPGPALAWTFVALLGGGMLAAIFLLPMLGERNYIVQTQWVSNTYDYRQHFVYLAQFFDPRWGYGYSVPGAGDGMSFQVGILTFIAAAMAALAALRRSLGDFPRRAEALYLAFATAVALFAMTPAARSLWDILPLVDLVQFPWRLLSLVVVTLALLAGAGGSWLDGRYAHGDTPGGVAYAFTLGLALASFAYTRPVLLPLQPRDESPVAVLDFELEHPDMRGMTRWSERLPANEDSPLIAQYLAGEPLQRAAIAAGRGEILSQTAGAASAFAQVRADSDMTLRFYTYYFPGWRATVDGVPAEITPEQPNGLITLRLPPGDHDVRLRFGATPLRAIGAALSLGALAAIIALWFWGRRRDLSNRPDMV